MRAAGMLNCLMPNRNSSSPDDGPRVVSFRARQCRDAAAGSGPGRGSGEVRAERGPGRLSSPHDRECAVFVFVIGLIGAGIWLADTMAAMRKNQDCALTGRRGCARHRGDQGPLVRSVTLVPKACEACRWPVFR